MTDNNLTTNQAAARAGVSISTMRHWCQSGDLPAAKHGHAWMIDQAKLKAFLRKPRRRPGQYDRKRHAGPI